MLATSAYLKVTSLSLRSTSNLSMRRVDELNAGIGELRQLLSCVVCCQLLVDPYTPKGKRCQHNVCRLCLRGKKRLFPQCSQCEDCSDFRTYEENRMMGTQLLCYKTLCVHLMHSSLYGQLAGLKPQLPRELAPRIKLPPLTTQEFIREGSNISDTGDLFLPQPDLPFLKDLPSSLPAETPPTTAATTPEIPYDHHRLNISEIEAEAAATAEQGHYSPLPLLPTGSRMGLLHHQMAGGQIVIATESSESGFMEHAWPDQVDLSNAVSVSSFPGNSTTFAVSYASTPFDPQELQIGQVVQMGNSAQLAVLAEVEETVETVETVETTTTTQLAVLAREIEEEEELAEPEEPLATVEEVVEGEQVAAEPPLPAEEEIPQEEQLTHKRKLSQVQTEWQEEQVTPEEAQDKDWQPNNEELEEEEEAPAKRKKTRTPKATQAAKIEPAPAEIKAKLQAGKGAFRKVRGGKQAEGNEKPAKAKCRCGVSGSANPLTTCRNGRCPCYKNYNSCAGCNCVGCKNPHLEDFVESDLEDDEEDFAVAEEAQPEQPVVEPSEEPVAPAEPPPTGNITLEPHPNWLMAEHPVVVMQNEHGQMQGFNLFQGNKPVDPVAVGCLGVEVQLNDERGSYTKFAYILPPPPPPVPDAPPPSLSPPPPPAPEIPIVIEPPAKKFRTSKVRTRRGRANFSALDTVDELVSGGSRSNSAAGDRSSVTDNAHSLFEEIMSGSDDL
ncbi:E3 ubiquitin-protein ligase msl-2 [Drosophila takahashii]|uniref:E3 ubiquitin-protein ligase msl-2 n=1 Tax=Drosophila takahashii TaxID=29030 RepID=UPI001CF8727B|nr:E3 ubiquitin-protein ligase msl-2 [Drosophila takahashii]